MPRNIPAVVRADHMPAPGEDEREEARLFYVRATQRLIIGLDGESVCGPLSCLRPVHRISTQHLIRGRSSIPIQRQAHQMEC
jgi:hypothetical protein